MKRTQIYLDEDQDERLGRRAQAAGTTKSAVIRAAIDAFLVGPRISDQRKAIEETFGAMRGIRVPHRSEWDRGRG
ncbi:MAG: CopG family transcriptional regulator [Actinomycetota bacterium]